MNRQRACAIPPLIIEVVLTFHPQKGENKLLYESSQLSLAPRAGKWDTDLPRDFRFKGGDA